MTVWEFATTAFVTLFVIVDPIAVLPIFAGLTRNLPPRAQRRTAIRAVAVSGATLLFFTLTGDLLLGLLGISFGAFRVAGGLLLLILAIEMVFAHQSGFRSTTSGEEEEAQHRDDLSVFPIGIPLLAGPGAIASVVLLMGQAKGSLALQSAFVGVLAIVMALTLATLLLSARLVAVLGVTGVNVLSRIFGIVLAGLAIQYIADGIRELFPAVS